MALRLLPTPSGKPTLVNVPSRRSRGGKGKHHKKGFHRARSFFSKPWVRMALVLVIAEALAVTALANLPKLISPQALIFWLYGSWKKNKQALAFAAIFQAGRIASVMGITAAVANASSNIKLSALSTGSSGSGAVGSNSGSDLGTALADLASGFGGGGGGGGDTAPGGQSSDGSGNPVPATDNSGDDTSGAWV